MIRAWLALCRATIEEIFDQAAYARFLDREKASVSRETYAAFLRENELAKARRPRCC